jgi:hypothetical protein
VLVDLELAVLGESYERLALEHACVVFAEILQEISSEEEVAAVDPRFRTLASP